MQKLQYVSRYLCVCVYGGIWLIFNVLFVAFLRILHNEDIKLLHNQKLCEPTKHISNTITTLGNTPVKKVFFFFLLKE